jgi:hypothetical protein
MRVRKRQQEIIRQARRREKFTVREEDDFPLREASKCFIRRYREENNWDDNDPRWLQHLYKFRICEGSDYQNISQVKEHIRSINGSRVNGIKGLIETGQICAKGISYGNWKRFNCPTTRHNIASSAFIAFCDILKLDWQAIGEEPSQQDIIYSNLVENNENFIIRETKLQELLDLISDPYIPIISVESLGSFGKTVLVQKAAFLCLQARESDDNSLNLPSFDAFIFISCKKRQHTDTSWLDYENRESKLRNIYREIAGTLEISQRNIKNESNPEKLLNKIITKCNKNKISTLLIIDDLKSEEDVQDIKSLVKKLASSVKIKVLITSCIKTKIGYPFSLKTLSEEEAQVFIKNKANEKGVNLTPKQHKQISDDPYRIPGAIIYALDRFKRCTDLTEEEVAQFLFAGSLQPLMGKPAYYLLMALVMFPQPALRDAIAHVAFPLPDDNKINDSLQLLENRLLIKYDKNRYEISSPLTRTHLCKELTNNPHFEQEARKRWLNWYLDFSQGYGKKNYKDWYEYIYIDYLDAEFENLKTTIEWCKYHNKVSESLTFWRNIRPLAYHQGASANSLFNRLEWTDWLIEASAKNPDYSSHLFELFYDKAWTLTLIENFIEAKEYFRKAWQLSHYHDIQQIKLAIDIIYFYWKQKKYDKAALWSKFSDKLLNQSPHLDLDFTQHQNLRILHYSGRIYYEQDNFHKAIDCFLKVVELAKTLNLQRAIYLNQKWLADLYIKDNKNKNLGEAEKLLNECLSMAEDNIDESLIAHCRASMADLKRANQHFDNAKEWAELAYQDFKRLEMYVDQEIMRLFIQSLEQQL